MTSPPIDPRPDDTVAIEPRPDPRPVIEPPVIEPPLVKPRGVMKSDAQFRRFSRIQMAIAAAILLAIVIVPIALISRPRTIGAPIAPKPDDKESLIVTEPPEAETEDADTGPEMSELRVVSCADASPKRVAADACDKLEGLEAIVKTAARESMSCVSLTIPGTAPGNGGVVPYAIDLSFAKKKPAFALAVAKEGRTLKSTKVAARCADRLKERLEAQSLDGVKHDHVKYKLSVAITYPGAP